MTLVSKTQKDGYKCILLFDLKEQLKMGLQNENDVNKERSRIAAASSVDDSTKHNGIVTQANNGETGDMNITNCKRRELRHLDLNNRHVRFSSARTQKIKN